MGCLFCACCPNGAPSCARNTGMTKGKETANRACLSSPGCWESGLTVTSLLAQGSPLRTQLSVRKKPDRHVWPRIKATGLRGWAALRTGWDCAIPRKDPREQGRLGTCRRSPLPYDLALCTLKGFLPHWKRCQTSEAAQCGGSEIWRHSREGGRLSGTQGPYGYWHRSQPCCIFF